MCKPPTLLALVLICTTGCIGSGNHPTKNEPERARGESSLYDRLGGGPAIYAIADNLIERTMSDPRVNLGRTGHQHVWTPTPDHVAELKTYWSQFLGMLAGGPQLYEGRNMLDLHRGMDISQPEWDAFMDDFRQVLAVSHARPADQQELLARVAGTHDVIVDK